MWKSLWFRKTGTTLRLSTKQAMGPTFKRKLNNYFIYIRNRYQNIYFCLTRNRPNKQLNRICTITIKIKMFGNKTFAFGPTEWFIAQA